MISIISVLLPLVGALALVYPLGETMQQDLVLAMVGGALGYLGTLALDMMRGPLRLHEGAVCLSGHHVSYTFMLLMSVPAALAAAVGAFAFNAVPGPWALLPALLVYAIAYVVTNTTWRSVTKSVWPEDWANFIEATTAGGDEGGPAPLRSVNQHIDKLFTTGGGARNVYEFEMLLVQALMFRGFAIGLEDTDAVETVFMEMALEGDERESWVNRDLDEEVWKEIAPVYGNFAHVVRGVQNKQLHGGEDE